MEIAFSDAQAGPNGTPRHSFILYRDEYASIAKVIRFLDELSSDELRRRERALRHAYRPAIHRRWAAPHAQLAQHAEGRLLRCRGSRRRSCRLEGPVRACGEHGRSARRDRLAALTTLCSSGILGIAWSRWSRMATARNTLASFASTATVSSTGGCNSVLEFSGWGHEAEGLTGAGVQFQGDAVQVLLAVR